MFGIVATECVSSHDKSRLTDAALNNANIRITEWWLNDTRVVFGPLIPSNSG